MAKVQKRPAVIGALLFDGTPSIAIERFLGDDFETWIPSKGQLAIRTLEGEHIASAGDWIIRGVKDEYSLAICKGDSL